MSHRPTRSATIATTAAAALLTLSGCNGIAHPERFPTQGGSQATPRHAATANPQPVTTTDFGTSWGLSVDHGVVSCTLNIKGDPVLRFIAPNGTVYALNSLSDNANLPPISDIAEGPVGPLRAFAFTVCAT